MLLNCQIKLIIKTFNKKNKFKIKEKNKFSSIFSSKFLWKFFIYLIFFIPGNF
jgi:hypothetical protein